VSGNTGNLYDLESLKAERDTLQQEVDRLKRNHNDIVTPMVHSLQREVRDQQDAYDSLRRSHDNLQQRVKELEGMLGSIALDVASALKNTEKEQERATT